MKSRARTAAGLTLRAAICCAVASTHHASAQPSVSAPPPAAPAPPPAAAVPNRPAPASIPAASAPQSGAPLAPPAASAPSQAAPLAPPDASAPVHDAPLAPPDASDSVQDAPAPPKPSSGLCVEEIPEGKARPKLVERFPNRTLAGHAAWLEVELEHGQAETVMSSGLAPELQSGEASDLKRAGFVLPDPEGGAKPRIVREEKGDRVVTRVSIPVVPLPEEPGRHELVLPPLPIALTRASGDLMRLCTQSHLLVVDEPIANDPNPKPKPNPLPKRQLEIWEAARQVTLIAAATLAIAGLLTLILFPFGLFGWLKRKLFPAKPAPPPKPPWETAMEELFDIRNAGLIQAGRFGEHYDRVSDTLRKYLGGMYGFDGLESTTYEIMVTLRDVEPPISVLGRVETFLRDADLVKFARLTPTTHQCEQAVSDTQFVVDSTRPAVGAPTTEADEHSPEPAQDNRPPTSTVDPSGTADEQWAPREGKLIDGAKAADGDALPDSQRAVDDALPDSQRAVDDETSLEGKDSKDEPKRGGQ